MNKNDIVNLVGEVVCEICEGKKRVPGGKYKGEVIDCVFCNGRGTVRVSVPLDKLRELLK